MVKVKVALFTKQLFFKTFLLLRTISVVSYYHTVEQTEIHKWASGDVYRTKGVEFGASEKISPVAWKPVFGKGGGREELGLTKI